MKKMSMGLALTVLFAAQIASAQAYYSNPIYTNAYSGTCVSLSRDLTVGSRGSDVLSLQRFIVSRNYPGGGSWMLTSYFGPATRAGVINFQMDMRLQRTGIVDAQTRAAISNITCGHTFSQPVPVQQYPWYTAPTQPWYNYNNSSYGQNYNGNCGTVYGSSNCQCGWYTLGGSNYFNNCGANNPPNTVYPYNPYPYNNNYNSSAPSISNVSGPTSLNVNTTGTWIVSINNTNNANYSNYTNVSVNWGENYYGANASAPQQLYGISQSATFTHAYAQAGTYTVTFTVSNSYGSNTSSITVQVGGSSTNTPHISTISPTYGSVGTQIVITGSGFTGDNTVHFGVGGKMHVTSMSGNYIYFTVPSNLSPCDVQTSSSYCAQYIIPVTSGQYQIYVTSNGVNSNSLTFTVQ